MKEQADQGNDGSDNVSNVSNAATSGVAADGSVGIGGSGAIGTTDDGMAYSSGAMYKGGVAKKYTEPKKPKYTKGGFVSRRTKK